MEKKLEEVFGELYEAYENYRPDHDAFEDGEAELEEMKEIEMLLPVTEEDYQTAINMLCAFLRTWFPDEVSNEEQEELESLLEQAMRLAC